MSRNFRPRPKVCFEWRDTGVCDNRDACSFGHPDYSQACGFERRRGGCTRPACRFQHSARQQLEHQRMQKTFDRNMKRSVRTYTRKHAHKTHAFKKHESSKRVNKLS